MFAADFFQIPPRDGHPCLSGYTIPTTRARWGLASVRHYSCRAYKRKGDRRFRTASPYFHTAIPYSWNAVDCVNES